MPDAPRRTVDVTLEQSDSGDYHIIASTKRPSADSGLRQWLLVCLVRKTETLLTLPVVRCMVFGFWKGSLKCPPRFPGYQYLRRRISTSAFYELIGQPHCAVEWDGTVGTILGTGIGRSTMKHSGAERPAGPGESRAF